MAAFTNMSLTFGQQDEEDFGIGILSIRFKPAEISTNIKFRAHGFLVRDISNVQLQIIPNGMDTINLYTFPYTQDIQVGYDNIEIIPADIIDASLEATVRLKFNFLHPVQTGENLKIIACILPEIGDAYHISAPNTAP